MASTKNWLSSTRRRADMWCLLWGELLNKIRGQKVATSYIISTNIYVCLLKGANYHEVLLVIYGCITTCFQMYQLKTTKIYYFTYFWGSGIWEWLCWHQVSHEVADKMLIRTAAIWRFDCIWRLYFQDGSRGLQDVSVPHHVLSSQSWLCVLITWLLTFSRANDLKEIKQEAVRPFVT